MLTNWEFHQSDASLGPRRRCGSQLNRQSVRRPLNDDTDRAKHFAQETSPVIYMVIETFKPGAAPEIYRRSRDGGRSLRDGLVYLNSWVDLDYSRCFQLMETDDVELFDTWIANWSDLTDFEVVPVRTSAEAAAAISDQL